MSKKKKPLVTDPKEPLLIIALYEALKGEVNASDFPTPPYVERAMERYEKEYAKN